MDNNNSHESAKLKAYKIAHGTFYTGPFATSRGNPDFGIFPSLGKWIFILFSIYYMLSKNYKYTIYVMICYMIGSILNGIRFYYVNTLASNGEDEKFLNSIVYDNAMGTIIALITIIYILLKK